MASYYLYWFTWHHFCFLQVLVATSTLAWGVNFPAHLVVVKGTEYFDGKTCRYVDFPITGEIRRFLRSPIAHSRYSRNTLKAVLHYALFHSRSGFFCCVLDFFSHFHSRFLYQHVGIKNVSKKHTKYFFFFRNTLRVG